MDLDDGYSFEEDFFNLILKKLIPLDALIDDSSDDNIEDGFKVFDDACLTHAGGAGNARLDRAPPRPFIPSTNGEPEIRR